MGPLDTLLGSSWAFQVDKSEWAKTSKNLNTYCIFGPQGVPRGVLDEPNLGSCWLPKRSKNHLRSISSHADTVVAPKGRSRSQFEAVSGTTPRLPGPSPAGDQIFLGGPGTSGGTQKTGHFQRHPPKWEPSRPSHTTPNAICLTFWARGRGSANERRNIKGRLQYKEQL